MLTYLDSGILIYFIDHTGVFNVRARNRLVALAGELGCHFAFSCFMNSRIHR